MGVIVLQLSPAVCAQTGVIRMLFLDRPVSIDATVSARAGHAVFSMKHFAQTHSLQSYILNLTRFNFGCNVQTCTEVATA